MRPRELFAEGTKDDEASFETEAVRTMRSETDSLLRAHGWTESPAPSAQYSATMLIARRTTYRTERRTAPAGPPMRTLCDSTRLINSCPRPSPPRVEVVRVEETDVRAVLVLQRRADKAREDWIIPFESAATTGARFAREVLDLLLTPARD